MTDHDLTDLLQRTVERVRIGPAPVERITIGARRNRRRRWLAVTTGGVAVVAAIGGTAVLVTQASTSPDHPLPIGGPSSTPSTSESPAGSIKLDGTWTVDALIGTNGESALTAPSRNTMKLTFADGTLTGTTGCNDVFGTYRQSGDGGKDLLFPRADLGSTLVGCQDEPPLVSRLLDVRHMSASDGTVYLHAENWMIIVAMRPAPSGGNSTADEALTNGELAKAAAVARQKVASEDATITSATVTVRRGTVTDSNTGTSCTSGRLLNIKLIGSFPHIGTTGHPVSPGEPSPDFTVGAVLITADARSGKACLIGVQTREHGEPQPEPNATVLDIH